MAEIKICPVCGAPVTVHERMSGSEMTYWLEAQSPRWISVKERLPEAGELVAFIPTINQGSIYVGKLSHTGARGGVLFENRQGRTTMKYYAKYWMPLPEPPKEE